MAACLGNRAREKAPTAETAGTPIAPSASPEPDSLAKQILTETAMITSTQESDSPQQDRSQLTATATLPRVRPQTPTSTPPRPVLAITSLPYPGQVISAENAGRLVELARWGKGEIFQMLWSPDGRYLAAAFSTGIYFFDRATLTQAGWIDAATDRYTRLVFSPDGTKLAAGFMNSTAQVWGVPGGELLQSFPDLRWRLESRLALTRDGQYLVSLASGNLTVWRLADRARVFQAAASGDDITLSPGGPSLAVFSASALAIYQLADGKPLLNIEFTGQATSLAYSPDGKTLALALFDQANRAWTVEILRASDGSRLQVLNLSDAKLAEKANLRLAFAPGGATLGAWTDDRQFLRFWRMADGQPVLTLEEEQFAFSPDGSLLAAWYYDDPALRAWRTTDGSLAYTLAGHESGVSQAKFSPEGNTLATVSGSGIIQFWDAHNGHWTQKLGEASNSPDQIDFSPGAATAGEAPVLAVLTQADSLSLWELADGRLVKTLYEPPPTIDDLAFTPDGQSLVYRTGDLGGCRLRAADGTEQACFLVDKDKAISVLSPDGATAFLTHREWGADEGDPFWLLDTSKPDVQVQLTLPFSLTLASFPADGKTVVLVSPYGDVAQYNVKNGIRVRRVQLALEALAPGLPETNRSEFVQVFLSPNGESLVSVTSSRAVSLWSMEDGSLRARLEAAIADPERVAVDFSDDGTLLAVGAPGQPARLFGLEDSALLQSLAVGSGYSQYVVFMPGDQMLASGSQNRLEFWDIPTGLFLNRSRMRAWLAGLAASPDGRLLATVTEAGVIQIWGVLSGE